MALSAIEKQEQVDIHRIDNMTKANNILELAKKGNPKAIEAILNKNLNPKGIAAQVSRSSDSLNICLKSSNELKKNLLVSFIGNGIKKLEIVGIQYIDISASKENSSFDWTHKIKLANENSANRDLSKPENLPRSVIEKPSNSTIASQDNRKSKGNLSQWKKQWEQAEISEKTIFLSTLMATLSMFLPWVDLGFGIRSGFVEGSFLFLGLYIYPFWSSFKQKPMNKVWGLVCAVIAVSFSLIYMGTQEMVSILGVAIFLLSSIALGVGVYQSKGYWKNYWKEFNLKGKIILASLALAVLSIPLTWSYFQNNSYDFISIRGYNIPEILYMLFFLYPSICLFQGKTIKKKFGLTSAILALLFALFYLLSKANDTMFSPMDEIVGDMCSSEYSDCSEELLDSAINNTGLGIYVYFFASILLVIGVIFGESTPTSRRER